MLGVNFLSFGKRERILRKTHKKYASIILVFTCLIILLGRNIFKNTKIYNDMNVQSVSANVIDTEVYNKDSITNILSILDDLKLFIENISYTDTGLVIDVRLVDKKYIYNIVDNLKKKNLNVNSYVNIYENNGVYLYKINIGV